MQLVKYKQSSKHKDIDGEGTVTCKYIYHVTSLRPMTTDSPFHLSEHWLLLVWQ